MNFFLKHLIILLLLIFPTYSNASLMINLSGNYFSIGNNISFTDSKFQGGLEISIFHFNDQSNFWYGGYTDFLYNINLKRPSFSIGLEFGYGILGFDCGFLYIKDQNNSNKVGFTTRFLLCFAVLHLYVRVNFAPIPDDQKFEFGFLMKIPIRFSK